MDNMLLLSSVASVANGELLGFDCEFSRLCTDTRAIEAGDLFVALKGDNFDAHDFLSLAQEKGACAVVAESVDDSLNIPQVIVDDTVWALGKIAELKRDQYTGTVVAITGSCGKTTVKGMLASIFKEAGPAVATKGNLNNHIGVPLTLMNLDSNSDYAVVEMGASGLTEIAYLTALAKPNIAVVLNVQPAHIGGFGSIENVAQEKGEIYSRLGSDGIAVINLESPYANKYLEATKGSKQIFFGFMGTTSVIVEPSNSSVLLGEYKGGDDEGRQVLSVHWLGKTLDVLVNIPGEHNLSNAMAAAACALAAGVNLDVVKKGLESFAGVDGRMQEKRGIRSVLVVDDTYNANPASMTAALDYLSSKTGQKFFIMGDMAELGEESEAYHREIGRYAAEKKITRLYSYGDESELAAQAFGYGAKHYKNKLDLVNEILPLLDSSATVLVKGSRSAQMETIVNDICDLGESE